MHANRRTWRCFRRSRCGHHRQQKTISYAFLNSSAPRLAVGAPAFGPNSASVDALAATTAPVRTPDGRTTSRRQEGPTLMPRDQEGPTLMPRDHPRTVGLRRLRRPTRPMTTSEEQPWTAPHGSQGHRRAAASVKRHPGDRLYRSFQAARSWNRRQRGPPQRSSAPLASTTVVPAGASSTLRETEGS